MKYGSGPHRVGSSHGSKIEERGNGDIRGEGGERQRNQGREGRPRGPFEKRKRKVEELDGDVDLRGWRRGQGGCMRRQGGRGGGARDIAEDGGGGEGGSGVACGGREAAGTTLRAEEDGGVGCRPVVGRQVARRRSRGGPSGRRSRVEGVSLWVFEGGGGGARGLRSVTWRPRVRYERGSEAETGGGVPAEMEEWGLGGGEGGGRGGGGRRPRSLRALRTIEWREGGGRDPLSSFMWHEAPSILFPAATTRRGVLPVLANGKRRGGGHRGWGGEGVAAGGLAVVEEEVKVEEIEG